MAKTRDYKKLHPGFGELILTLLLKVKEAGYNVKVVEGVRSMAKQASLYAKGRTAPGKIVTKAKAGDSHHNYNLAVDLCLNSPVLEGGKLTHYPDKHPVWNAIGKAAKELGLEWGGDWKQIVDRPHVQLPIDLKTLQTAYAKTKNLEHVYNIADKTVADLKRRHKIEPLKTIPIPLSEMTKVFVFPLPKENQEKVSVTGNI